MHPRPTTLELPRGRARLEPLAHAHAPDLLAAAADPGIWRFMPFLPPTTPERMRDYIDRALAMQAAGEQVPFAIIDRSTRRAVGSTRYLDIDAEHRHLEIGATWLTPGAQRTSINTECKYLLLRHAFEGLADGPSPGAVRVQIKTDARNDQSQRAILRIGATFEGRLRRASILPDGFVRDVMYFSVIAEEWPGVKARLESLLAATR